MRRDIFLSFWCFTTLSAVAGHPREKGPGASLHRTATHMHLKKSGAVLLVSLRPRGLTCSPSPATDLVTHLSAPADSPPHGGGLSLLTLVHTPFPVHARYVTSRAMSVHKRRISDSRRWGTPDPSPQRGLKSRYDRACPHRRSAKH